MNIAKISRPQIKSWFTVYSILYVFLTVNEFSWVFSGIHSFEEK